MRLRLKAEEFARAVESMPELVKGSKPDGEFIIIELGAIKVDKPPPPTGGPGTELKRILAAAGIHASGCQCDARALEMDQRGIAWCRANAATIVGWLADAAKERGFPFSRTAGYLIVQAAIAAARRKSSLANEFRAE